MDKIDKWYEDFISHEKYVIDIASLTKNLYTYCKNHNAFHDSNLLGKITYIHLTDVYVGYDCLIDNKYPINYGFIHYQILRHIIKVCFEFWSDYRITDNRKLFRNMFKNYDNFNLQYIAIYTVYWPLDDLMRAMLQQPNVFLYNTRLKNISLYGHLYNKENKEILEFKENKEILEFSEYYNIEDNIKITNGYRRIDVKIFFTRKKINRTKSARFHL